MTGSAVKTMSSGTETNREKLLNTAAYDLLLEMQERLEYAIQNAQPHPCIMDALGENLPGLRCCKYNGDCPGCIAGWLSEPSV